MRSKFSPALSETAARTMYPIDSTRQKFWGTLELRERWSLSWRAWLLVALVMTLMSLVFIWRVYPFLALTHRVNTKALVVEGWIHDYALRAAVTEFRNGSYQRIFTTGGPVEGSGGYTNDYHTNASVGVDLLKKYAVPEEFLQMVPSRVMDRDRTYASAVALRNWFREHNIHLRSVNVLTENVHARRTRLLFSKALGPEISVGIIAVPNPDYDARRWWRYSDGVREVVGESIAYIYARFFFYPATVFSGTTDGASGSGPSSAPN